VKVIWSREEDMQHDIDRPATLHKITAGIDARGQLKAISHQLVSPSILQYVYPAVVTDNYDARRISWVLVRLPDRLARWPRLPEPGLAPAKEVAASGSERRWSAEQLERYQNSALVAAASQHGIVQVLENGITSNTLNFSVPA